MNYNIVISKKAQKFIIKQSRDTQERLLRGIHKLPNGDVKTLQSYNEVYRLRIGNYRIIYTINENVLLIAVTDIGNRGDIYK